MACFWTGGSEMFLTFFSVRRIGYHITNNLILFVFQQVKHRIYKHLFQRSVVNYLLPLDPPGRKGKSWSGRCWKVNKAFNIPEKTQCSHNFEGTGPAHSRREKSWNVFFNGNWWAKSQRIYMGNVFDSFT